MRINLPPNNADYFGAVPRFGVVPRGTRIQLVQAPRGPQPQPVHQNSLRAILGPGGGDGVSSTAGAPWLHCPHGMALKKHLLRPCLRQQL